MTTDAEFQAWIRELSQGGESAAQVLWEEYFDKLVRFAYKKLAGIRLRVADEEDIALSALGSFVRGVQRGRFPQLTQPDDLWRVLLTITARKAIAQQKKHFAKKRGGAQTRGGSALDGAPDSADANAIAQVLGRGPTAAFQAMMTEECESLFARLDDPRMCVVALCKLEGHSNEEIADVFGTTTRSVERWLRRIREAWEREA